MAKLHELHFKLLQHPPSSPNLAPSDSWLFADFQRMFQRKRFSSNEKVISKSDVYFEAKDKFKKKKKKKKKGIELLEKHWNQCITLEGDYIDE